MKDFGDEEQKYLEAWNFGCAWHSPTSANYAHFLLCMHVRQQLCVCRRDLLVRDSRERPRQHRRDRKCNSRVVCITHVWQTEHDQPEMLHTQLPKPGHALHVARLHARAHGQSILWTKGVWTCWKSDLSGNGNGLEHLKTALLSIKTQRPADTVRFRNGKKFSSHASGNTDLKPGWNRSFSPSLGRGWSKAPSLSMADEREGSWREQKVEVCLLLSSVGLFHVSFLYHGVLCSTFSCDPLLVVSLLRTDFPGMYFSTLSPPLETFWELLSKH